MTCISSLLLFPFRLVWWLISLAMHAIWFVLGVAVTIMVWVAAGALWGVVIAILLCVGLLFAASAGARKPKRGGTSNNHYQE